MKKFFTFISALLIIAVASCAGTKKDTISAKATESTDSCTTNHQNRYEVYVPQRKSTQEKLPLLVILDSHGSGKFALEKFKKAATNYGIILVASDLVKNGYPDFEQAIQTLVEDVRQKYPINDKLYITGFSGGARMALGYALSHPTQGLILCGALGSPQQIGSLSCPIISISGTDDFNFIETAQFMFQEQTMPSNLKIELLSSSHSWPDSETLSNAVGFLTLYSSEENSTIENFCKLQKTRIDTLKKAGEWIKAEIVARDMATTPNLDKDKSFSSTYNTLKSSEEYNQQMQHLAQCLNQEGTLRQKYGDAFSSKDEIWWKNEIKTMNKQISQTTDQFTKDLYLRIKGFWGIACYSYCNQAASQRNETLLSKILLIYKEVEPQNSDMLYFSAFLPYWKGDDASTVAALQKAISNGFADFGRLKNDFPITITSKLHH